MHSSSNSPPTIAYGIDIGVYYHGLKGQVLADTTFAWARADSSVKLIFDEASSKFSFDGDSITGRDIRTLQTAIRNDLSLGSSIAIGIEAPMWQPAPRHVPQGAFELFEPRFAEEQDYRWYLQSGAAATVKALSIGSLLFSGFTDLVQIVSCSTTANASNRIRLFEGFVAGRWKLPHDATVADGEHAWDALTTAVAFHWGSSANNEIRSAALIHESGSCRHEVISHWRTVVEDVGMDSSQCKTDCMIVGFDSEDGGFRRLTTRTDPGRTGP